MATASALHEAQDAGRRPGETLGPWPLLVSKPQGVSAKSPLLYLLVFGLWLACVIGTLPFAVSILQAPGGVPTRIVRLALLAILWIFWVYGAYNLLSTAFGFLTDVRPRRVPYERFREEDVAILYPTYNDFSDTALAASIQQTHPRVRTYVLDDSTDPDVRARIDAFAREHPRVTVVRRAERAGFKAGALNHAMRAVVREPFLVLMDSDEILPRDFVEQAFTYFAEDAVGFVQANHDYNRAGATRFADALGIGIDIHWDVYQPPRNRWGFVMLLGHGAMFKREVWEKTGGFPELVSEDLAFATRACVHGYRGVFAKDVVCLEDFPVDYEAFRKRHRKWTGGTVEYLREELPAFLRSGRPSLTEKLDVLIPVTQLPITFLSLTSILLIGFLHFTGNGIASGTTAFPWLVAIVAMSMMLSPLASTVIALLHRPRKLFHYATTSMTVYTSVSILAVTHGLRALFDKRSVQFVTTPKRTSRARIRLYGWSLFFGALALAISYKSSGGSVAWHSGVVVGAAGLSWVLASVLPLYNDHSRAGRLARTVALVPLLVLLLGVAYGALMLLL